ncbi:uncharacterized protein ACA1_159160 [Acanthamoeba castellanii str. Neff]|uniref:Uncharacterized protein n=1 Tax=Acanthamoeba castellanii (strain ATCC 30010 / Neff) TaxID=1257118 RepID=L8HBN2_ACACF|nr:uncharacterized protein ACA1_159160 [Acanthamoeba castellanii str. Neff]ELR22118.1 hypothetical protein ACA1_159160 [Acanthamoeba castellanii str. Neff]
MEWIPIAPLNYEFSYYALDIESGVVVRINDYNHLVASLVALSFVDGVRAYVDALERHKDNLEALQSFKPPEEVNHLGELCIEANDIFARFEPAIRNPESLFAYPSVFDGSEGEEDDYCNSSRDEDEDSDDEDSDDDEEIEYDDGELRLNMGRLKRHKLTELRLFVKKHNIEVFGRMKDDLVDAITSWKQRQEEEDDDEDEEEQEQEQEQEDEEEEEKDEDEEEELRQH